MRGAALLLCVGLCVPPEAVAQEVPLPPARPEAGDAAGGEKPERQEKTRGQEKPASGDRARDQEGGARGQEGGARDQEGGARRRDGGATGETGGPDRRQGGEGAGEQKPRNPTPAASGGAGAPGETSPGSPAQPAGPEEPTKAPSATDGAAEEPEGVEKIDVSPDLACRERLRYLGVTFETVERIAQGACGIDAPVKVSGLADGIEVAPAITIGCDGAETLARWVREVVAPAAREKLGTVSRVVTADAYSCRNRNQAASGRMSEHALGRAVDIAAVTIAGRDVAMAEGDGTKPEEDAFRAAVRRGACSYFTTVLGPGSDASHKDHMHLDVIARTSGYRLCQ